MKEIKFRAWDIKNKKMIKSYAHVSKAGQFYTAWTSNDSDREYIPMQSTGLKDKNGVDIYEGDIVRISENHIEVVKWVDESNWMADKCPVNGWVNHESIYKFKPEVIGNIYENPELLDKD
jgi:uncharacterized phage protein (TIGR01671 family)